MTKTNTHHGAFAPMLESPIPLLIARLAVPTIISMLVTAIYNMADTFFVSQLGTSASGAVGIVFSLMAIIQVPSLSRQGLASVATVALNVQAGAYGDAAVAGMSITGRIFMFVLSVMIGLGQGFQPVAGFCYGAKRYDRVKKGFIFTLILGFVLLTLAACALFFGAPALIRLFRDDPLVIEVGTNAVRYQSVALPLLSLIMTGNMLLQSTGHAHQATFFIYVPSRSILFTSYFGVTSSLETYRCRSCAACFGYIFCRNCCSFCCGFFQKSEKIGGRDRTSKRINIRF